VWFYSSQVWVKNYGFEIMARNLLGTKEELVNGLFERRRKN